ncbi:hypothetical protein [Clostridium felsineum]|uniref:hypothetical protein n=1 Tax=Clostridium felsineum TaxID=36839 RepID=UPI00098C4136|nr:hypothetical protein [Clostridium felsineum]URZ15444.1 hypothetical protein CLFE_014840 [Clostridium felsineum DSM 794]
MGNNKKVRLIEKRFDGKKLCVVTSVNGQNNIVVDSRSKRPIGVDKGQEIVYIQEINRIEFGKSDNVISYYAPNNVGILLSIANKALINGKNIYEEKINPNKYRHSDGIGVNTFKQLSENTSIIYEYIEDIQTSIVFGYTAIEAFTNLSINEDYQYKNIISNKGIIEIYDKKAIERWLSLDVKISDILVDIYQCESIKRGEMWNKFKKFEKCRNEIVHQKSIEINSLYEEYFNEEIFELCNVPEKVIKFFFEKGENKGINNVLWPFVINTPNEINVFQDYNNKESWEFVKKLGDDLK